ncbi:uncharacterized protein LOC107851051 isoform X3 [Capsicum annuum]|uniref:uncharacterized protein LOC107851051 isoform X3 n=1 Tax=Capsicum annuum TaxID=4072 RepID=UPI0007BEE1A1|nr:uncharacterized protein LOC107851051 isoform X3 [Capsicum annuum]
MDVQKYLYFLQQDDDEEIIAKKILLLFCYSELTGRKCFSLEVSSSQSSNHEKNLMELPVSPDSRFSISRHVPVVVSLNSTDGLSQRLQVLERREQVSTQQKRRKHVNAVDKVISTSSPVRNSSNHMLRYIASLTPDEARAYAKREIENAPLVTDDHDLYTPLFRNVSMFKRYHGCHQSRYYV